MSNDLYCLRESGEKRVLWIVVELSLEDVVDVIGVEGDVIENVEVNASSGKKKEGQSSEEKRREETTRAVESRVLLHQTTTTITIITIIVVIINFFFFFNSYLTPYHSRISILFPQLRPLYNSDFTSADIMLRNKNHLLFLRNQNLCDATYCNVHWIGWFGFSLTVFANKSIEDLMGSNSEVHFSGFHMDCLEQRKAGMEQPTTSEDDLYKQPFVIGVAGGAASGKTAVCDMIIQQLHDQRVVLVNQDSFYHNLTEEELTRVQDYNFDHPEAFDTEQLLSVMDKLKRGQAVNIPKYDFKGYKSGVSPARRVNPADVIILEGILIFHDPRVRALMNMKIFVDTDADVRLARRIRRDTAEKARDIATVLDQYSKFVKPAFDDFILPTKKYADIIIPRGGDNHVAIDLIVQHIRTKLGQHDLCKIYPNLYVIQSTFQMRGMHTLVRDAKTTKHDFVFYSDRLIRLVVEHGLGHLPFTEKQVITPTGSVYSGVDFCKRLCGVSIIRSGESMENALRACCKGIKIGKILIHREGDNGQQLIYEKLPNDISDRHVLLLDPILGTGNSAVQAISLLLRKGVPESNIIFLNLISAPQGVHVVCKSFPRIKIVTSEIDIGLNEDFRVIPGMGEFGDRYFGTDDDDMQVVAPS
ncbi:hypothetical protein Ahy_A07g031104 isoform A [Arachis hypogaea]|uniref:Uridine kinase n=2 Tax=Arachis hypogaea TaxID=3818 RepID=A0A445C2W2_ARAHY|nr:hypothetical protein Ahy_A07g031104 isoform A [Arachis hypogaea]